MNISKQKALFLNYFINLTNSNSIILTQYLIFSNKNDSSGIFICFTKKLINNV